MMEACLLSGHRWHRLFASDGTLSRNRIPQLNTAVQAARCPRGPATTLHWSVLLDTLCTAVVRGRCRP